MSRVLLFSDVHVHTHKNSLSRLDDCLKALEWSLQTAIDHGIADVLFLGDLFQDRQKIQILSYHKTYQVIRRYANDLNIFLLIGNHDMWYSERTDITSVYPFGAISNVTVIDKPSSIQIAGHWIDFMPYTHNPLESVKTLIEGRNHVSRILCGHIALDGAQLNTFHKTLSDISVEYEGDMTKVDAEVFAPWKRVFLGHYHGAQKIGHVEYVGSPLQLNFAEAFQEKHVIILDLETLETVYVKNHFSPVHLMVDEDRLDGIDLNNTFVKIRPKDIASVDLVELRKRLLSEYSIHSLEFTAPKEIEENERQIVDAKEVMVNDRIEMIERYVNAVGTGSLEKDKLLEIGRDICQRSQVA